MTINSKSWQPPRVFDYLAELGNIPRDSMFKTFNMGIGYIAICRPHHASDLVDILSESDHAAYDVGEIVENSVRVQIT